MHYIDRAYVGDFSIKWFMFHPANFKTRYILGDFTTYPIAHSVISPVNLKLDPCTNDRSEPNNRGVLPILHHSILLIGESPRKWSCSSWPMMVITN